MVCGNVCSSGVLVEDDRAVSWNWKIRRQVGRAETTQHEKRTNNGSLFVLQRLIIFDLHMDITTTVLLFFVLVNS
jgi:hypothetical protein